MMTWIPRRHSRSAIAIALTVALAAACEDNSGPPEARVTTVEAAGGNQQEAAVTTALPQPLVARALDAQGEPVGGAAVDWQAGTGSGTIAPASATTDADGGASATWTLGSGAGAQTVMVVVGTASTGFTATATAGPTVAVTVSPSPVVLDAIGATVQLQVAANDAHDNPIQGRAPAWTSSDPAIATVDGAGVVTAVSAGTATVSAALDGVTGEVAVTVQPAVATIFLLPAIP
ncbi:MAG: Ig-like domain-containing protein, partial [Longimicrobiales bacterium]